MIRFNVWMPAVDAAFQRAIDELRDAARHRPRPARQPWWAGGDDHGHLRTFPRGPQAARGDEDARLRAEVRRQPAAGECAGASASTPFAGPVAILVDAMSGSATECFAGGMQSIGRARVFGQTSMGQALPALFDRLPNGDLLIHAYGDFVTADGTRLEGRGVVPDQRCRSSGAPRGHDATSRGGVDDRPSSAGSGARRVLTCRDQKAQARSAGGARPVAHGTALR